MVRFKNSLIFCIFIFHHTAASNNTRTLSSTKCAAYHSTDILCNNSTSADFRTFACVCYSADFSLANSYADCDTLVIADTLPALRLTLTPTIQTFNSLDSLSKQTVPLNGVRISYEYYFKRKISNIISSYCSDDVHSCRSLASTIHPNNVVILRLSCSEEKLNQIVMDYTILKSTKISNLSETSVIEPGLILAALKPKLEKTLPYKIIDHRPHNVVHTTNANFEDDDQNKWSRLWKENIGFIIAIIVIGCLLAIVYIVAILKAIRDRKKRQRRLSLKTKKGPNGVPEKPARYGAVDEQLLADSPAQKIESPHRETDFYFTVIRDEETSDRIIADPTSPNGATFEFLIQTPTTPIKSRQSSEEFSDFHPQPPTPRTPPPKPKAPSRRSIKKVTSSKSLQFQDAKPKDDVTKLSKSIRKATTYQRLDDKETKKFGRLSSEINSEPPTPPSLILEENRNENTFSPPLSGEEKVESHDNYDSDRSRTSTIIQVPVLIVPAMTTFRNDNDYENNKDYEIIDKTPVVEEKYIDYDRKNGNSDDTEAESKRKYPSGKRNRKHIPPMRPALSEESLLPRNVSLDQQISSVSSDIGTSDVEGNLDAGGFHLLLSGIGYQPLRESDWSVSNQKEELAEKTNVNGNMTSE